MKKLNNIKTKLTAKAMTAAFRAKEAVDDNAGGAEILQALILIIAALVLGALLLSTMKTQFSAQLTTVGEKMTALFN